MGILSGSSGVQPNLTNYENLNTNLTQYENGEPSVYSVPSPTTPIYDPNLPVYAAPEVNQDNIGINQKPSGDYVDPALATVEGRSTNLLQPGNPLLARARALSNEDANRRGLLNTRGAVQAGTTAMIDKALQIATPDAALYGDLAKGAQAADTQAELANQAGKIETSRMRNNAILSASLTRQEQQGAVELQRVSDNAQMQRIEVDNQWKQLINWENLDQADQQAMAQVSQVFGESLTGGIERILRDTNIENKEEAIKSLMETYKTQMTTAGAILGIDLNWS